MEAFRVIGGLSAECLSLSPPRLGNIADINTAIKIMAGRIFLSKRITNKHSLRVSKGLRLCLARNLNSVEIPVEMVPMPKNLNNFSKEEIRNFLDSFDTVLTDCDGVLWLENNVIQDSQHTVNKFMEQNKTVFYVTNNNSKTREEYAEKCSQLGFKAAKESVVCTAYLAAEFFKSIKFDKKVYILGSEGLVKELDKVGIKHTDIGPEVLDTDLETFLQTKLKLDPEIGAVLLGFDQHFSYPKMVKAATYLKDPNVHFVATCPDETFPANTDLVLPGTGCFLKCLEAASGRKAFVLGKPNNFIKDAILRNHSLNPSRTLMIGDRCNTDILFGTKCGFKTLLVLTGVTSLSDVESYAASTNPTDNDLVPQFYIQKLGDLLPHMSA